MPLSLGMQIHAIFIMQLFVFLHLPPAEADISAYSFDNRTENFADLPARFGFRLPSEGLKGFLISARPENGCEPMDPPPPPRDNATGTFIVLIKRYDCTFDVKVLNAQRAGYKGAIVHNVNCSDLISMESNNSDILKQIHIPSVFVGEDTANSLKEEFTFERGGHVILMPDFSLPIEYYLIPFLVIVGICLVLIFVFMITKFVQDRRRTRRSRLRKDQLKKLPVHKFRKGDVYDVCAICLDEYEEGEKLRVLPCSHAYHCKCVDPWLTKTRKTCPVCKQKVVPSRDDSASDSDEAESSRGEEEEEEEEEDDEEEASETTPLLRSPASSGGGGVRSFGLAAGSPSRHGRDADVPGYGGGEEGVRDDVAAETVVVVVVPLQHSRPEDRSTQA